MLSSYPVACLYDLVKALLSKSPPRQERVRADRALRLIVKELQRRKVPL